LAIQLTENDFAKPPRGARVWQASAPVATPFGNFVVELGSAPDAELLAVANELAAFVSVNFGDVFEIVFADYQRACEDRDWMRGCDVPLRLTYDRVPEFVRDRTICVRRERGGSVTGAIFLVPEWDVEHGIELIVRDGQLVSADR
jgi:hypothetical protein